jgi:hypothetical protein
MRRLMPVDHSLRSYPLRLARRVHREVSTSAGGIEAASFESDPSLPLVPLEAKRGLAAA